MAVPLMTPNLSQNPCEEATLDTLIVDFGLPSKECWRSCLREWAFGRHAKAAFLEYRTDFLFPITAALQEPPVPMPDEVANMELKTCHILGGIDKTGFTAQDHALRFCFELLHGAGPHRVWNPLCDALPPKKASNDRVDFFGPITAAGLDRELKKLGRVQEPPPEPKLIRAAVEVLRAWTEEWRIKSPDYPALLQSNMPPLSEKPAGPSIEPTKAQAGRSLRMTKSRAARLEPCKALPDIRKKHDMYNFSPTWALCHSSFTFSPSRSYFPSLMLAMAKPTWRPARRVLPQG
ncbi:hypothetical protein MAPG_03492 [Magnaporthiopsis poae ATCC 64411]|uniref:Uncharacterized protein n=1 Tax=Magnaporthiopsis poae (strain ATCC 64411 / 73-15) TaxID=644358 RepID=A0A0C4DU57_MAGP6|nr:hypothetical protein MAPG_03492 [Magnaporthiopsis poae ATCC 64411]